MVSRRAVRIVAASVGTLLVLLMMFGTSVSPTLAYTSGDCTVRVDPATAAAGSSFTFIGTGFHPTTLALQKVGEPPTIHDINVGTADPWRFTVRSRVGDEGRWTATFSGGPDDCTGQVEFRVTLSNTDAVSDAIAAAPPTAPALLFLSIVVLGFAAGALAGRRVLLASRADTHVDRFESRR
jgi:hypothetical protein